MGLRRGEQHSFEVNIVAAAGGSDPESIGVLSAGVDQAIALLRQARYGELDRHLRELELQTVGLQDLRQALRRGLRPPAGVRDGCEQLGRRLFVLSAVAKQIVDVESGMAQLLAAPPDAAYGRDGQCGEESLSRFRQDA